MADETSLREEGSVFLFGLAARRAHHRRRAQHRPVSGHYATDYGRAIEIDPCRAASGARAAPVICCSVIPNCPNQSRRISIASARLRVLFAISRRQMVAITPSVRASSASRSPNFLTVGRSSSRASSICPSLSHNLHFPRSRRGSSISKAQAIEANPLLPQAPPATRDGGRGNRVAGCAGGFCHRPTPMRESGG